MNDSIFCGVDIGASAAKLVLIDDDAQTLARVVLDSGVDYANVSETLLVMALERAGRPKSHVLCTIATGYGRDSVGFADKSATELLCHSVACHKFVEGALTVVDMGGQDNKVIHLDEQGSQLDFKMNRKCAAGTGAFLEEIALRLRLPLAQLDPLARSATRPVDLSSFCTVFAKTEILSHLRQGTALADVVAGAFEAVVTRVVEMDPLEGRVVLTGGVVAHNPLLANLLGRRIGHDVSVPPHPQHTGALGAALLAREHSKGLRRSG